jgi:hypothetical protein
MLGIAGFFIARSIHVHETGTGDKKTVSIDTPLGNVKVNASDRLDPQQVGIPLYPGSAKDSHRGGANVEVDSGNLHKDYSVSGADYYTPDPPEKVRDFYQRKLPDWTDKWQNTEFHMETKREGRIQSIVIKPENDGTHIGVASIGEPAAN